MSDTFLIAGAWISAGLTIFLFSFLYKDNPFFKVAEHLYLGAGMGWWAQVYLYGVLRPKVWAPLMNHDWMVLVPTFLGLSLITQFIPGISWISRYGFTFLMGYGAGLELPTKLATDFVNQIGGTIQPFVNVAGMSSFALFNAVVIAGGVICVLIYFFFSVEHKGAVKKASNVGIYFLMIYFGASFGNTVMARFSLLYGRFDTLYTFSASKYLYATQFILAGLAVYFIVHALMNRGKKEIEPAQ
ncbi:MAG: hypothetical protein A2X28_03295 [Elusimicrobia bacterium GWA2_56_46]|nr:MAG: hypothetical protein A2X28_03295 [Elusimicrobia bacterium GWA2_56_46]OGR54696.1 MAG: hypothetical protein A2X39_02445 [Elusimicrobia bacterium GWC2_56_31]HBB66887.1 hypothetical protein [Elusimicrobiota bacterium]HBW23647.1 hypothetical protein [Elusimicrobiota bacterium]